MSQLLRIVQTREAVERLCAAIDAGQVTPTDGQMADFAKLVAQHGGPLAHDLLCQLASRCTIGREVLKELAQ